MEQMETHVGKMETQLAVWGAKLDELLANAGEADTEAKADYHKRVHALKAKYQVAQAKLAEVKVEGGEKWATFKDGLEVAWKDLEVALNELSS